MDVLISIVVAVLLAEGYVWVPRLSDWLIEHAVSQLVRDEQDRYREEWKAHLHDYPNSIVQLVHALSFAWPGATRRRGQRRAACVGQLNDKQDNGKLNAAAVASHLIGRAPAFPRRVTEIAAGTWPRCFLPLVRLRPNEAYADEKGHR